MSNFKTTIGLEIHVQLATKSKMFCRCDNSAFGKAPNTTVCPVCLGMPGMLPVTNKQAVEWTIKTGLALNCEINKLSKFDRKHYFYPDLPKGYQISQYDQPFACGGELKLKVESGKWKVVRLNRIHLEEDAGKLVHKGSDSLVDLNRAGTPLMEIVTEPDIESPEEAAQFMRQLQKIVRDVVQVSEASMEKGHLRCDANISVTNGSQMSEIVEIKNINSFKFVEKALHFEEKRLIDNFNNWPEKRTKITRGFDSQTGETYEQRAKEEAADYRYFPEPDLPPIDTTKFDLESLKSDIAESEEQKVESLIAQGVAESDAKVLANNMTKYEIFSRLSEFDVKEDWLAKVIVHNYFGFGINEIDANRGEDYAKIINQLAENKINKNLFVQKAEIIKEGKTIEDEVKEEINIEKIVAEIIKQNPKEVERYKNGENQLLGFFVGQVMKETNGKADPREVNRLLTEELKS